MESLDDKRTKPDKEIEADRQQVKEWLASNHVTRIKDDTWTRNGEVVKQIVRPDWKEREGWVDSPWNWR